MVRSQVPGAVVYVKAVGDVVAIKGEVCAVRNDGWRTRWAVRSFGVCLGLLTVCALRILSHGRLRAADERQKTGDCHRGGPWKADHFSHRKMSEK